MDLSGLWKAAAAHDELRRTFHEPQLDDRAWCQTDVPGHWAHVPELAQERVVLHRFRFESDAPDDDHRSWLNFAGICQQGDVWLDGAYVGDTEGYFVPHSFEITDLLRSRSEHLLAIDVSCPEYGDPNSRTDMLGAFLDPELSGVAGLNPGGIWRPVTVCQTGCSSIQHFRAVCLDANTKRARVTMRCVFDTPQSGPVVLRTEVAGHDHEFRHDAATGENRVEWTFEVPDPDLWWPHSLGSQPLHDLVCTLLVDGRANDHRTCRIGFRSVRMKDFRLTVNGTEMFVKGISKLPTAARPGDAEVRMISDDLEAVRSAGLDLVRCHTHIARPELYDRADELGLLVWQDMPLRGLMARGVRKQAVRQTREAVDLLAHHPSVAIWCAHDEPQRRPEQPLTTPAVMSQQLPSWNRMVLDGSVKRVLERTDGSRPIIAHTDVPPHLPQLDGTTSNFWFGWAGGRVSELTNWIARFPRMGRFVSAFGAASIDPDSTALADENWPDLDWDDIGTTVGAPSSALLHLVDPAHIDNGADWGRLTEAAQANITRSAIEQLRRLKYRPTGGFIQHCLADAGTDGGFGVLTRGRRVKPAWTALIEACQPVIVVADDLPVMTRPGDIITVAIHVISDLHTDIDEAVIIVAASINDSVIRTQRWGGSVAADECSFIGNFDFAVPTDFDGGHGNLKLAISLSSADITADNQYRSQII